MDRALDLKPEVPQGCGFELQQEVSTSEVRPLSKAPNPQLLQVCVCVSTAPGVCVSTAPGVCVLGWVKYREHISLLVILCITVYVTNKVM